MGNCMGRNQVHEDAGSKKTSGRAPVRGTVGVATASESSMTNRARTKMSGRTAAGSRLAATNVNAARSSPTVRGCGVNVT